MDKELLTDNMFNRIKKFSDELGRMNGQIILLESNLKRLVTLMDDSGICKKEKNDE